MLDAIVLFFVSSTIRQSDGEKVGCGLVMRSFAHSAIHHARVPDSSSMKTSSWKSKSWFASSGVAVRSTRSSPMCSRMVAELIILRECPSGTCP